MNAALSERLENLSPAKRMLLEMKLKKSSAPAPEKPNRQPAVRGLISYNQESLLFLEKLNPGSAVYNLTEAVRITGGLDREALRRSLELIVTRHEALRMTFFEEDGVFRHRISDDLSHSTRLADLTSLSGTEREAALRAAIDEESVAPMDPFCGPLFRTLLIRLSDSEHVLCVSMHHIISDGWSVGVFWNEFQTAYRAFADGKEPETASLPVRYGDFTSWSRERLDADLERQTEFWRQTLSGAPPILDLPSDRPRPAAQSFRGAEEIFEFPAALRDELKALSRRENVTLFMTMLAGFNAFLKRCTGRDDLVVGSPIAGRDVTETESLIGFFVNTLALRNDLSGDPTVRELLGRVRSSTLDAFSHQELPFDRVVAAVSPERSLSCNPIYQTAFALQTYSKTEFRIPGLVIEPLRAGSVSAKFDVFFAAKETESGLALTIEYATDLFDAATIRRFAGYYLNLLEALPASLDKRISELPLIGEAERVGIVSAWNRTGAEYPQTGLAQIFEDRVRRFGGRTAVLSDEGSLDYERLNVLANRIARRLRELGAVPGTPVGIFMERSALMTTGILGIVKSGAAYMPMDPSYPAARLEFMMADASAPIILTTTGLYPSLPKTGARVICLDAEIDEFAGLPETDPEPVNSPDDPAYIIYTSGSTGQPKGTVVPHRAVARLVINTNYAGLDENSRVAHISNVSFDAATYELWGALLNGGVLAVIGKDVVLSPDRFVRELREKRVTSMFLTTALFNLIARENPDAFGTLDTVMFGGEACDPAAVAGVLGSKPPKRLLHVYGPTETTTFATWHLIESVPDGATTIPIGRPISNTTAYILDEFFNPVPAGIPGEIFIGGDGLAHGYLNRPELTAEKFVAVPAGKIGDEPVRLYRTGDIARFLPDGAIEFIGRRDNQVKLRGFRIELGEIETALKAHDRIADAVVCVREIAGDRKIAAFCATVSGGIDAAELRGFLKESLPDFMIPSVFVTLDGMELNANGKIDRARLPEIAAPDAEPASPEAARDEIEIKLTEIWKRVLGKTAIGVSDNFFELGGHSLVAVRMFAQIEKTFGCTLPLATLFKAPTIAELAGHIRGSEWKSTWGALVPLKASGSKAPFFCVHAVGGNILEYNDLARNFDADRPFFGLQAIGLDGRSEPLTDIRQMAERYLEEIRQIQPAGPYFLGGRSFGGTVAFEMARLLEQRGERVALLAILDSYPKGWEKLCSEAEAAEFRSEFRRLRVRRHLANMAALGPVGMVRYVAVKIGFKSRKIKHVVWNWTRRLRPDGGRSVTETVRDIEEINYRSIRSYVPDTYGGKLTFFSAAEEIVPEENLTGWRRMAAEVEVVEVPGDHQTMIKPPQVETLARRLCDSLAGNDAQSGSQQ